ncbi:hypothetical protein FQA47_010817 [Oryzias melastigma]|uniref:Uncharacterized protein n=1 Tax=Oryzias melastigma TaxID=30732 RepID=A0A834KU94_ORYME|nr:hypothetical protein FQA47_010817 [Oryzias melastigma]
MTAPRRSRCEADSRCAVAPPPQHTSPSGSRELECAGPISFTDCAQCRFSFAPACFSQLPRQLLIIQQAQNEGIPVPDAEGNARENGI